MGGRGRGGYRGGNKRGRTQRRDFKDGRPNEWKKPRSEVQQHPDAERGWQPFVTESLAYEKYYKKQGVVPAEEWDLFIETLKKPLPTCFRINGSGQFAQNIRDQMQHDFFDCLKGGVKVDGEMREPIKPLEWYPGQLAWTLSVSRMQLRKMRVLRRIHEFLKQENEIGSITRQEAVSMLPPLFLKVEPHHRVLDMCAAPGSKTFQLLEMIHKDDRPGYSPEGLVIANDLDVQRCHLLIHQTKRMCSPNILVTNHEAQHLPGLRKKGKDYAAQVKSADGGTGDVFGQTKAGDAAEETGLLFDRVLCDVPCSGDGTIRKAPDIWKKWHCGLGNGIHPLQVQIAMRGVALLKVGGRLVYSTCSLNPVEDEAVVGEMLRQAGGSLELLDVSSEMPGLKYRPGLKSWLVRDKRKWLCTASEVDRHRAGAIVPSMFPSGKGWDQPGDLNNMRVKAEAPGEEVVGDDTQDGKEGDEIDVEEEVAAGLEVSSLPLERCMRILPHDQNSGGFFIAVFRKVAPFKKHPNLKDQKNEKRQRDQSKDATAKLDKPGYSAQGGPVIVEKNASNRVNFTGMANQIPSVPVSEAASVVPMEEDIISVAKAVEGDEPGGGSTDEMNSDTENASKETYEQAHERRLRLQGRWRGVDPVLILEDESVIQSVISHYGIKDSFPVRGHLVTRSEDVSHLKRIYYVSNSARDVLNLNFRAGQHLKIISAGLKMFERQITMGAGDNCAFRIASEGLPMLLPHMTKQIVHTTMADFKLLLREDAVPFYAFHDPDFAEALQSLLFGCCVVVLPERNADGEVDLIRSIGVGCWRGRNNVSLLISKAEAAQLRQRLSLVDKEPNTAEGFKELSEPTSEDEQQETLKAETKAAVELKGSAEPTCGSEQPDLMDKQAEATEVL